VHCTPYEGTKLSGEKQFMKASESLLASSATRRQMMWSAAAAAGVTLMPSSATTVDENGISHSAEAIHQEPVFKANPKQVYDALCNGKQFDRVQRLSEAMRSMAVSARAAEISAEPGSAFSLFGGYITGRQVELVPGKRIVQAWRAQSWNQGNYSIVRFDLVEQNSGTKIIFDHMGFPAGKAEHLAAGWKSNYWEPLEKFLSKP
jgi:activator of HSP90 ATPase